MGKYRSLHLAILLIANFAIVFALHNFAFIFDKVMPLNDVLLYGYWLNQIHLGAPIFGVAQAWVYPFPALLPMFLAEILGGQFGIQIGWSLMLAIINLFLIAALTKFGQGSRKEYAAAWLYLGAVAALGPVAIGRIDSFSVAIALFGLLAWRTNRFKVAVTLFSFGTWIKIWPAALAVAGFFSTKKKLVIAVTVATTNLAILIAGLALGGNSSMLSFLFQQSSRGIQIESPVATIWLWLAKFQIPNFGLYFDKTMLTNQVSGGPVSEVSAIIGVGMFVALGISAWLAWRAFQKGADPNQVFSQLALVAVLVFIVFNKVGSPQFMIWLVVPAIAAILFETPGWKTVVIGTVSIALLTQLVYPIFYIDLMSLGFTSLCLLTTRNLCLVIFLVWSTRRLAKL